MTTRKRKTAAKPPAVPAKSEDQKDQDFLADYQRICEKHKRGLSASPAWRHSLDGNDFRLIINITVQRMGKE